MTNGHDLNQSLGTPEVLKHHAWLSLLSSSSIRLLVSTSRHLPPLPGHCHTDDCPVLGHQLTPLSSGKV